MRVLAVVAALTLAVAAGAPSLASSGCPLFPADNVWHAHVSRLPVHPRSEAYLASLGTGAGIHADFGSGTWEGGPIGIPYTVVPAGQPRVPVRFGDAGESDPGPYPIPPDAPVEGGPDAGGDRHVLVVQARSCRLYELFDAHREAGGWRAGSGAVWDLRANRLRPAGWTSVDNGSSGFIGGVPDERWDNDALHQLGRVTLADFEAVDTVPLRISPASAAFRGAPPTTPARARPAATSRARPAPAPLAGVGRRSLLPEPRFPPASAEATPAARPALDAGPAAARTDDPWGSGSPALLPQILAAVLGLVAAALAFRQVALRSRDRQPPGGRPAPGGRHARTGRGPDPDQATPAPPGPRPAPADPQRASSRRRP
jgi:hypothetical protein